MVHINKEGHRKRGMFVVNPIFFAGFLLSGEIFVFLVGFLKNFDLFQVSSWKFIFFSTRLGLAQSLPLLLLGKVLLGFAAGAQVFLFRFLSSKK